MMCFLIKTISPTRLEWKKFFVDLILFVYAVYKIISMEEKELKILASCFCAMKTISVVYTITIQK